MRVGVIGRFQPLHLGHEELLKRYANEDLIIAIGSANVRDEQNPLTYDEREAMLRLVVPHATILALDDYNDDGAWAQKAIELFGELDVLVTGNDLVAELLEHTYTIVRPEQVLDELPDASGTMIRAAIRANEPWERFVSDRVEQYLRENGICDRIKNG